MCAFLSLCLRLQSMVPKGPSHPHTVAPHLRLSCPRAKEGVQGSKAGGTVSGLVLNSSSSFSSGARNSTHSISFISGFSCHSSRVS